MREGHWDTTHQGIAIASDGTLVDGQHRLLAIVESGVTVRMNVTFNKTWQEFPLIHVGDELPHL